MNIAASLEELGLTNFYKASNFIQAALKIFFRTNKNIAVQLKILAELDSEFDTYKNIFPPATDALIQNVVANQNFGKRKCMEIFYRRLGDPRFGDTRFNWDNVSQRSKNIFGHWLSAEDLETFFEIIRQTAVDKMWRYREKFWRAYLPYITKTKIFLGSNAKSLAAQLKENVKLNHGDLRGAAANQSVFIFQIGRYIFSEWSHNGKLRVHKIESTLNLFETAADFFEHDFISRSVLEKNFIEERIHSSPKTYFWQREVSEWLKESCGIDKTQKDWRLET